MLGVVRVALQIGFGNANHGHLAAIPSAGAAQAACRRRWLWVLPKPKDRLLFPPPGGPFFSWRFCRPDRANCHGSSRP
jgi:hypothetical protein